MLSCGTYPQMHGPKNVANVAYSARIDPGSDAAKANSVCQRRWVIPVMGRHMMLGCSRQQICQGDIHQKKVSGHSRQQIRQKEDRTAFVPICEGSGPR